LFCISDFVRLPVVTHVILYLPFMKIFLMTLFIAISIITESYSQKKFSPPYNEITGEITQTKIVETGKNKDATFNLVRAFLAKKYPSYKDMVQVEDLNSGQIIFSGAEPIYKGRFDSFSFATTVDIKDGKYRCVIDNVKVREKGSAHYSTFSISHSMIKKYDKEIEDLEYLISTTKKKRELSSLNEDLAIKNSFRSDYIEAHHMMALRFDIIQLGMQDAVLPVKSIGKAADF